MSVARIYALIDPRTKEIRYVGWTIRRLSQRLRNHLREKGSNRKVRWVQKLRRLGLEPQITLVQEVPSESWVRAERYWIAYFKILGCDLVNGTDGGEGVLGHHHSKTTRDKLSQLMRERWSDPEMRAAYLSGLRSKPAVSVEHREILSRAQKKRWAEATPEETQEHGSKVSAKVKGKPKSEEHKSKLSASLKGRPKSAETRAKMARAHRGMRLTAGAKAKISAKMRGRPKTKEHVAKVRAALLARSSGRCGEPT